MPLLEAKGLAKSFGKVVTAKEVSFTVAAGQVLGVVGPNGAGKSTLLSLVTGALPVDAGTITFQGREVTRMPAARRAALGIGRTFQVPRPFGGLTVFENVLVGAGFGGGARGKAAHRQAWAALDTARLTAFANTQAASLRLLDRKRLELARALATRPHLLLLDEIAGGLSDQELPELIQIVKDIRDSGTGIVWIEHIVHALLQVVDELVCLAQGDIVASGDPHEVMTSKEVAAVYLGSTPDADVRTANEGNHG